MIIVTLNQSYSTITKTDSIDAKKLQQFQFFLLFCPREPMNEPSIGNVENRFIHGLTL